MAPPTSPARGPLFVLGVVGALTVLALHVREYWFLTDDAFIAFRYARNLADGHGLVFNPGHAAVEGFTSLLWVLLLALFDRVGLLPENVSVAIGVLATFAVWGAVLRFWKKSLTPADSWLALFPAWALALDRSFAVWATGGLETRVFEALVIVATLRLVQEQAQRDQGASPNSRAPWLYALACLARPEGVLIAAMAATAVLIWRARHTRPSWNKEVRAWAPVAITVVGETFFRRAYFHEWLPNTWYAKSGGELFLGLGARYVMAFAMEYALWLWVPLLAFAYSKRGRSRFGFLLLVVPLMTIPHLLYVIAVGGDHFEYRPLGLEIIGAAILMPVGIVAAGGRRLRTALCLWAVAALLLSTVIPWESHRQFPARYQTGFPGAHASEPTAKAFLDPRQNAVTRLPILEPLAEYHRGLLRDLTARLVAVRQEEHRLFLATVRTEGTEIEALVQRGVLPRDVYVAIDCVGAIPYHAGVRTLDRLGLTDSRVAHSPRTGTNMAHWRFATIDYAREQGVDLWAEDRVHLLCALDSRPMLRTLGTPATSETTYVAEVSPGRFLLCQLPQGLKAAKRRMPMLRFMPFRDPVFLSRYLPRLARAWQDSLARDPSDNDRAAELVELLTSMGEYRAAIPVLDGLIDRGAGSARVLELLAYCQAQTGMQDAARITLRRALEEAARTGDTELLGRWQSVLNEKSK